MKRRGFFAVGGSLAVGALAGCSEGGTETPDPDTDPTEFLPELDGWTLDDTHRQNAGIVGAEAGIQGEYTDPDGEDYTVEILRWSSREDAEDRTPNVYDSGWAVVVTHGVFGFAGNGPDVENVRELLAASSALSESIVSDAE
ncbi:hypothetical protein PM022_14625 [Halorubrum ezzemoulense]|jgi:hypothetical protein|nr:hypothetical protein [Halorubrum ezzemoulense]MDB2275752.1 hypothetical protein [Halorubrum ezzemoulense]